MGGVCRRCSARRQSCSILATLWLLPGGRRDCSPTKTCAGRWARLESSRRGSFVGAAQLGGCWKASDGRVRAVDELLEGLRSIVVYKNPLRALRSDEEFLELAAKRSIVSGSRRKALSQGCDAESVSVLHIGNYYAPHRGGIETQLRDLVSWQSSRMSVQVIVANVVAKARPTTETEVLDGARI